jgi:hypothetical protein
MRNDRHPVSESIVGRWQEWRGKRRRTSQKESREQKLERAALELDLTAGEVSAISTRACYKTNLLPLRMALLQIDPGETIRTDPQRFRSLETSCRLCDVKGRCTFDIAQNPSNPQWQQYCPNASTLCAMHTRKMSAI